MNGRWKAGGGSGRRARVLLLEVFCEIQRSFRRLGTDAPLKARLNPLYWGNWWKENRRLSVRIHAPQSAFISPIIRIYGCYWAIINLALNLLLMNFEAVLA